MKLRLNLLGLMRTAAIASVCVASFAVSAAEPSWWIEKGPHGDLYVPEGAGRLTPKVLAIHGGGWRARRA